MRRRLERYRYGMAAYKVDWALSKPIPWRAEECRQAGTVHLGGTLVRPRSRAGIERLADQRAGNAMGDGIHSAQFSTGRMDQNCRGRVPKKSE